VSLPIRGISMKKPSKADAKAKAKAISARNEAKKK
jgi:hypothetical protein